MQSTDFGSNLASPAQRALTEAGILRLEDLGKLTRYQLQNLHGIGKSALETLETEMRIRRILFKQEAENPELGQYIDQFASPAREFLYALRQQLRSLLPLAVEKMAYGMPTYYYKENIVHFAGFKAHIGFYPTPSGTERFQKALQVYKCSKGAIQFPLDKALPHTLIEEIVRYRMREVGVPEL